MCLPPKINTAEWSARMCNMFLQENKNPPGNCKEPEIVLIRSEKSFCYHRHDQEKASFLVQILWPPSIQSSANVESKSKMGGNSFLSLYVANSSGTRKEWTCGQFCIEAFSGRKTLRRLENAWSTCETCVVIRFRTSSNTIFSGKMVNFKRFLVQFLCAACSTAKGSWSWLLCSGN